MTPYEKVIDALEQNQLLVSSWGTGQRARCPSHDDDRPSLSVAEGDDGRALVYCFAGCAYGDIVSSLGLTVSDLFGGSAEGKDIPVAQYIYTDERGHPLIRVTRFEPKGFTQERWEDGQWKPGLRDTRRVIYNLPEVLGSDEVYVVEGEKDALSLAAEGKTATTCLGGSSNWRDEYATYFSGKSVIIVGDRDEAGDRYVSRVRLNLADVARSVRVLTVADGCADITEHLLAGWKLDELQEDIIDLSVFQPVDWRTYEVEDTEWLFKPYVPVGGRTLVFGKRGSLKSLWAMWLASHLSQEGKRVAYFSIEMQPSDTVRRLRQLDPDPNNLWVFTRDLDLTNPGHVDKLILGLKNFDLIVIDSWSSVHQMGNSRMNQNDEVAALDKEVLQPIIRETGATIMMIDNQGHDAVTNKGETIKTAHARGASAKEDKMETCLWFERPKAYDNYLTTLSVTKMRLDEQAPVPVDIRTPQDRIEFYEDKTNVPHWPGMYVTPEPVDSVDVESSVTVPAATDPSQGDGLTPFEQRRLARLEAKFGKAELGEKL